MPNKDPKSENEILEECLFATENAMLDEIEQLIWAAIDGHIEPADSKRLETLLSTSKEARKKYIDCATLHAELITLFRQTNEPTVGQEREPILDTLLTNDLPGTGPLPVGMEQPWK